MNRPLMFRRGNVNYLAFPPNRGKRKHNETKTPVVRLEQRK